MIVCDNLYVIRVGYTYRPEKLHHYSLIDHLFILNNDLHLVKEYSVIDTGTNLSDHCAISATFVYKGSNKINVVKQANEQVTQVPLSEIFWTPRNFQLHKNAAAFALSNIRVPSCCTSCQGVCSVTIHREQLNTFCSDISSALLSTVDFCKTSRTVRNVAWIDELSQFKKDSLEAHRTWMSTGRPRVGQVHENQLAARARYKRAIHAAHNMCERKFNDRLFNCLIKQDSQKF